MKTQIEVLAEVEPVGQLPYLGDRYAVRVSTGMPGAAVASVELSDGVIAELNGAGSVVSLIYPHGLEDL